MYSINKHPMHTRTLASFETVLLRADMAVISLGIYRFTINLSGNFFPDKILDFYFLEI